MPPIIPFVFYNGKARYNAETTFNALFQNPELASRFFLEGFILVDLNTLPDETLLAHKELAFLELPQKYALKKSMQKIFGMLFKNPFFSQVKPLKNGNFTAFVLKYILKYERKILPENLFSELVIHLSAEERKNMATLETRIKRQGRHEGAQEATFRVALKMQKKGLNDTLIEELTGVSPEDLKKLEDSLKTKD